MQLTTLGLILAGLISALSSDIARAATFTVTRFDDPAPHPCTAASCSLCAAILSANDTARAPIGSWCRQARIR